ncbi:hypothetical protein AVEN_111658-1 [Araneus ventricosus]|uniref:Uncharacterized protein n=1 Tax=Araneus ventricosus TaxID=182803 RepID=A0A4Y2C248_ARAVE|nr:hypothetical protein AVEN_111658-1 [Araneus ventricosus]
MQPFLCFSIHSLQYVSISLGANGILEHSSSKAVEKCSEESVNRLFSEPCKNGLVGSKIEYKFTKFRAAAGSLKPKKEFSNWLEVLVLNGSPKAPIISRYGFEAKILITRIQTNLFIRCFVVFKINFFRGRTSIFICHQSKIMNINIGALGLLLGRLLFNILD